MPSVRAHVVIRRPPEVVFDFVTRPEAVAETFSGWGPIPGARASSIAGDGAMAVGAIRRVENTDGTVVEERIVELDRPRTQAYELISGLPRWLIRGARGRWVLTPDGADGTAIAWTFTFDLRTFLVWPAAAVMLASFKRAMRRALATTKEKLEGEP